MSAYGDSDEHLDYLIRNCGVRGYDIPEPAESCTRPDVDVILRYIGWMGVPAGCETLEVGCGIGRILKELHDVFNVRPCGVDRTAPIVEAARARVGGLCRTLQVGRAEDAGFADAAFDRIICWGVFDLCDQTAAAAEMARMLRSGGRLLLTGKNDLYEADDAVARVAEDAARRKGVSNHFTDFDALLDWAGRLGLAVTGARYFQRRGDMQADVFVETRPPRFYEYALILERRSVGLATGLTGAPSVGRTVSRSFAETPVDR
jgi:SAM-dependent methyltransferase